MIGTLRQDSNPQVLDKIETVYPLAYEGKDKEAHKRAEQSLSSFPRRFYCL